MCADCGEKSANFGPEGPKKLWCAYEGGAGIAPHPALVYIGNTYESQSMVVKNGSRNDRPSSRCAGCARKRGVLTGAKARAAAEAGGPSSPQGLPSVAQQRVGWRQHWSEDDGRPYWTGPDGESTWTKPDHYA
jgi:hypothetical protein